MGPVSLSAVIMSLAMSVVLMSSSPSGGAAEDRALARVDAAASTASTPVHLEFEGGTRWLRMHARLASRAGGRALDWGIDVSVAGVRGALAGDAQGVRPNLDLRGAASALTEAVR